MYIKIFEKSKIFSISKVLKKYFKTKDRGVLKITQISPNSFCLVDTASFKKIKKNYLFRYIVIAHYNYNNQNL